MNVCKDCNSTETSTYWYKKNGIQCKKCYMREYRNTDSFRARRNIYNSSESRKKILRRCNLKRKFGITTECYDSLLVRQNFCCAICKVSSIEILESSKRSMAVDHDHKNGKVRGLLCSSCNVGIGHFRDSPTLLQEAISYLLKNDN